MRIAVIPAFNEEAAIGTVVLKARRHVDRVLVVDDGSKDGTAAVARDAGAEVIGLPENRGKGNAVRIALEAALKYNPTTVVLLDGDGQHDPDAILSLVEPVERGAADVVIGSRTLPGRGQPARHRVLGRRMLDQATNAIGRLHVQDTQSGFRALRGSAVPQLFPAEDRMGIESDMLLRAARAQLRVVEVPIASHYPPDVQPHVHPARHGADVLAALLRFVREERPLGFFGGLGLVILLFGAFLAYQTAVGYYVRDEFWPGKAMLSMLLIIVGSIGILGGLVLDFMKLSLGRMERRR